MTKSTSVPATSGMVGTGLIFHAVSLLGTRGVPADRALQLISLQALIATSVAMLAGWLADRVPARFLLAAAMVLLAGSCGVALGMNTPWLALLYAAFLGLHGSILRSAGTTIWLDYFGRTHQGAIRGTVMAAMILAAAVGPLPLAMSVDWFGSYQPALIAFVTAPLLSAVLAVAAGRPQPPPRAPTPRR